jgi:hypothetical protein
LSRRRCHRSRRRCLCCRCRCRPSCHPVAPLSP